MIRVLSAFAVLSVMTMPAPISAHLLQKQTATMKLVGNTANFVVAVPVSALEDVDLDKDGKLSPEELAQGREDIAQQFGARFSVEETAAGDAVPQMTWVLSPETNHSGHGNGSGGDYVVVMHRVFFDRDVTAPTVITDLFGAGVGEDTLTIRATREVSGEQPEVENATLRSNLPARTFFAAK